MTVDLRTRVELSCWNLIIPMMTKLRRIRSSAPAQQTTPMNYKQFTGKALIWSAAGLAIGFGIGAIRALLG
jgi:hypothetical protein